MLPWIVRLRFQELRRQADCLIVIPGGEAMPAEAGVQSVSDRIQLHGAPALGLRFGKPAHGHKVVLVRLDVHCLHVWRWGWPRTTQSAFDLLGDRRRYLILQGEHVGEVAFKSIGPEMPIVRGAN